MAVTTGYTLPPPQRDRAARYAGDPPRLLFRRTREVFLNDRGDIDAAGSDVMGGTINTYLTEIAGDGNSRVYLEPDSIYLIGETGVSVPHGMTLEGPARRGTQGSTAGKRAEFKATEDATILVTLAGNYAGLMGIRFNLMDVPNIVGVRPNAHLQSIEHCLFSNCDETGTGIKGGGVLYLRVSDCVWSDGFLGRGIDLLDAYADDPGVVYYGVNVGWFERLILGARAGAIRAEGTWTLRDSDLEASYTNPAVEINADSAVGSVTVENNYFEITNGPSVAISIAGGMTVRIAKNDLFGNITRPEGSAGIVFAGHAGGMITQNKFIRFETGIKDVRRTWTHSPSLTIVANQYYSDSVTTPITYFEATPTAYNAHPTNINLSQIQDPKRGHVFSGAAVVGGVATYATGTSLDLRQANQFRLNYSGATTVNAVTNAVPGMFFTIHAANGNATLANSVFNLKEGADTTLAANEVRMFVVTSGGTVRQVTT